jgi:hypothetical protein
MRRDGCALASKGLGGFFFFRGGVAGASAGIAGRWLRGFCQLVADARVGHVRVYLVADLGLELEHAAEELAVAPGRVVDLGIGRRGAGHFVERAQLGSLEIKCAASRNGDEPCHSWLGWFSEVEFAMGLAHLMPRRSGFNASFLRYGGTRFIHVNCLHSSRSCELAQPRTPKAPAVNNRPTMTSTPGYRAPHHQQTPDICFFVQARRWSVFLRNRRLPRLTTSA